MPQERKEVSPGQLYRRIKIPEMGEEKPVETVKENFYIKFCKGIYKSFPSLAGKKPQFKEKFKKAIDFLDWNLKAEELTAASSFVLIFSVLAALILAAAIFLIFGQSISLLLGNLAGIYIFMPLIAASLFLGYWFQNYPISKAREEQVRALTYVPEIIGYMIMSMKLVPNLEKAVEFAAIHGRGKIADDLRNILWKVQTGAYNTLSEALDELALKWGDFSEEFKQALMMVRASVLEDTEAKRYQLLDKTMENLLEAVKNKMESYARELSNPSVMLFYLGVLLPLILIIILPVGSAFSGQALAKPEILVLLYNILIPGIALAFALNVIKKRPPTYEPPKVEQHPLLPKKGYARFGKAEFSLSILAVLILVLGAGASFYIHSFGIGILGTCIVQNPDRTCFLQDKTESIALQNANRPEYFFDLSTNRDTLYKQYIDRGFNSEDARLKVEAEKAAFFANPKNDTSPTVLVFGLLFTISIALYFYLYYSAIFKKKIQDLAIKQESEFKEALYILASRMGENKPVEDAMKHVRDFLPNYSISNELFGKTVYNIESLGMPLNSAIFDKTYGSLKYNPSFLIRSAMRLLVDSVQLGVNVASRTIISLSLQLSNSEKVTHTLKTLISDVSSMMRLMSLFIAPAILGITTALQKVVMITIGQVAGSAPSDIGTDIGGLGSFTQALSVGDVGGLATPTQFLIVVAVYVIEIVVILTLFTTKIEEDNNLLAKINIAKALPIAVAVFLISSIAASFIVGGFYG